MRASPLRRRAPDHRVSQGIKGDCHAPLCRIHSYRSKIVQTSDLRKPAGTRKKPLRRIKLPRGV